MRRATRLARAATGYGIYIGRGITPLRFERVGTIDEIALYDEAFTPERIRAHHEAGR